MVQKEKEFPAIRGGVVICTVILILNVWDTVFFWIS